MICKKCKTKEVVYLKWLLCNSCYMKLRRQGKLGLAVVDTINGTKIRLIQKYGESFLADLQNVNNKPYFNLKDIGDKYNLTRERIRQIYKKIYGHGFGIVKKIKTKECKIEISCINDPRRKTADWTPGSNLYFSAEIEKLFFKKCTEMGFDVEIPCRSKIDIIVNDFLIDVKAAKKTRFINGSKNEYYHYSISESQKKDADFFACYHVERDSFFIIPNQGVRSLFLRVKKNEKSTAKNRYWKFENAFHLLNNKQNEIFNYSNIGIAIK
jgi:hypothetical protein